MFDFEEDCILCHTTHLAYSTINGAQSSRPLAANGHVVSVIYLFIWHDLCLDVRISENFNA